MTAALRSSLPDREPSMRRPGSASAKVTPLAPARSRRQSRSQSSAPVVRSLPKPQPLPVWLKFLVTLQRGSSVLTFVLVAGVLSVYGWTVLVQQRWGHEYSKLETLRKHERHLVAANEVLKNQLAQQAERPDTGLVLPDPGTTVFLAPAPARPLVEPSSLPAMPASTSPLGY